MQLYFYLYHNGITIHQSNQNRNALLETTPHISSLMTHHEGHKGQWRTPKFTFSNGM
jgi:hypothetical protein